MRGLLSAGQRISELDFPASRYRGDILKAMRILARDYPEQLRLVLFGGIWNLIPVMLS